MRTNLNKKLNDLRTGVIVIAKIKTRQSVAKYIENCRHAQQNSRRANGMRFK